MVKKNIWFILIILSFMIIPLASAFEFDNEKFYDEETKTVTIKNCALWIFTCWVEGEVLAEYTLTENTDECLENCYAEGTATLEGDQVLFQDIEFRNKIGDTKEINNFKWFIEVEDRTDEMIPTYEDECGHFFGNGTEYCILVQNGTKEWETIKISWKRYMGEILDGGEYTWRIEGRKDFAESIDWIVSSNGFDLTEWAWWDGDWNYKKIVNVTSSTSTFENYSVLIEVDYNVNMETDFADLRFTNLAEDTELTYWIENKTDSNFAWVWVFQDELATGLNQFYMYYGKVGASTTSDIKTAFRFGDDFNDNSYDTNQWWTYPSSVTTEVAGVLQVTGSGDVGYTQVQGHLGDGINFTQYPYKLTLSVSSTNKVSYSAFFGINAMNNGGIMGTASQDQNMITLSKGASGMRSLKSDTYATLNNAWDIFVLYKGSIITYANGSMTGGYDGIQFNFQNNNLHTDPYRIVFSIQQGGNISIDYVYLNGYPSIIPTVEFGSEEINNALTITSDSPIDYYNSTSPNVEFICNGTDETGLISLNLTINSSVYETVTGAGDTNLSIQSTETLSDGLWIWNCSGNDAGSTETSTARYLTIDTTPFIQFEDPTYEDNANISNSYIPVNVSLTETYFDNLTFWFWTDGDEVDWNWDDNTRFLNDSIFAEGIWEYNVTVWATTGESNTTNTRTITIDTTNPILVAFNLSDITTFSLPTNSSWHYNVTDPNLDKCYYNYTGSPSYEVITCNTTQITNWTTGGEKTIQFCANDTHGNEECNTTTIDIFYISTSQFDNPDPAVEGFDVTFNLTVNVSGISTTTANLTLNNTIYSPTTIQAGANGYFFEVVINLPDTLGNISGDIHDWVWNYTIAGVISDEDTSTENITVYELAIDNCSTYNEIILDFSLNDEELATAVNETAGANVEIDLQLTSQTNSSIYLNYNNTWINENNLQVCIPANVLNNTQWDIDFTVGFDSTDRVWEFYYLDSGTLDSTKIFDTQTDYTIDLMDLKTADSTSFLFNYFDLDGLAVKDAIVHVMRKYIGAGVFREAERSKADENGDTTVHLVEEDVIYYFLITQYGVVLYTSSTYTALCQSTPCTIQIEASGESASFPTDWDLIDGGAYSLSSSSLTRNVNLTYAFNSSDTINLTIYKYASDGSYSVISSDNETGISGSIILNVPQSAGNVSFFATIYKGGEFINSEWINFEGNAQGRFGITMALFLGALIILTLGLMAVSEGVGTLVYVMFGVALSGFLGLITIQLSSGVNVLVYLIIAGGILLFKLTAGRK